MQVRLVVMSICLFQMVVGSFGLKNAKFYLVSKFSSGHCANWAVMLCWFGANKVKTKVHSQNQRLA